MRIVGWIVLAAAALCAGCQNGGPVAADRETPRARFAALDAPGSFKLSLGAGRELQVTQIGPIGGAMVKRDAQSEPTGLAVVLGAPNDGAAIIGYTIDGEDGWTAPDKLCGAAPASSLAILYRDGAPDRLAAFKGDALGGAATLLCTETDVEAEEPPLFGIQ